MFDLARSSFNLSNTFIKKFIGKQPQWGPVGFFTFKRTYAREVEGENRTEEYWETCRRVVEGTFSIQKNYCKLHSLPWDERKAKKSAEKMFNLMWNFKFLPPGRGLWSMGTEQLLKNGSTALLNCAFISTKDIVQDPALPFCFLMDVSMLGVGCGFDTRGADLATIYSPKGIVNFEIPDTREGWVQSVRLLIEAYLKPQSPLPKFNYTKIRLAGEKIRGFGGTASGPEPLKNFHEYVVKNIFEPHIGNTLTSVQIVDIMNLIGKVVVSGNSRRSAEIALGDPNDEDFICMKQDRDLLVNHRWASNNSILCKVGMNYSNVAEATKVNGEPGYFWLENAQAYGRMGDVPNWKDRNAEGCNPCQPSWATIMTPNGIRTMGEVHIGDIIWSGKRWTEVINKVSTGVNDVYEYHTRAGSFIGTQEHKVVVRGQKMHVRDAEEIDRSQCTANGLFSHINTQSIIDGLVLGDGMVHKATNNLVLLCIGEDDQDYFGSKYHGNNIAKMIGRHRKGISSHAYEIQTTITPSELPHTYERSIPDRFRFGSRSKVACFLRGLYSANGSVVDNRIILKASSFKIISQVQEMLSSLGIGSYYTTNKPSIVEFANGEYECRESYDLNITSDREVFARLIGFIQEYKTEKLNNVISRTSKGKSKTTFEIVSRQLVSREETFDITVDDPEHTYWTGGLLVSNCNEQTLESAEMCNLVESFPARHESLEEYLETLKIAYLYAKTVTLLPTTWDISNSIMIRNRRIGLSQSGIIRAFKKHGRREMLKWCDEGYKFIEALDVQYSNWLGIPCSIKRTSVKPSGTVSLLPGEPPGIHYPHAKYYIRRIRIGIFSPLIEPLREAGYHIEPEKGKEDSSLVISFPVCEEYFDLCKSEVSVWEQVANAVAYQKYWADNQVSITVTFRKNEEGHIPHILEMFEDSLKSISFLPLSDHGYEQAPYETIDEVTYKSLIKNLHPVDFSSIIVDEHEHEFCDGDKCSLS